MKPGTKRYLGDGVYVEFDGFGIWLTTENGIEVMNKIYLEPEVTSALLAFLEHKKGMKDNNGREWAKLSELKENDEIELDAGFTCRGAGKATVFSSEHGLYFECGEGKHMLDGQLGEDDDSLIGIYRIKG